MVDLRSFQLLQRPNGTAFTRRSTVKCFIRPASHPGDLRNYERLDKIVSKMLRIITLNQRSFPSALLYMSKVQGGLGFKRLSDVAHERKLAALLRLEWGSVSDRHLAKSLLGRALRGLGVTCSHGYYVPLRSDSLPEMESPTWWITSLLESLQRQGFTLHINGPNSGLDKRPLFLEAYGPGVEGVKATYQWLLDHNVTTLAEKAGLSLELGDGQSRCS